MDTMAKSLLNAAKLMEEAPLSNFVEERYAGWKGDLGKSILSGDNSLQSLSKLVLEALLKSGFTQIINDGQRTETNYYNYGVNEEESQATDIWDVIKIELDLIMDNRCLKCINY